MEEEVILLDMWASPFGMRVRIALAEKKIKYEYREEDLKNKSSHLLEMNPIHKKIPVLIHDGKPVCESLIIVQYIDDVWRDRAPNLLHEDPYERARARLWADFIDEKIYECVRRLWLEKGKAQEEAKKELIESFKQLDEELGEKAFFGGERMGFVDVALVPFVSWFYAYEKYGNFSVEGECPRIGRWANRCMEEESVSKTLQDPIKIYELVGTLKKKYGVE